MLPAREFIPYYLIQQTKNRDFFLLTYRLKRFLIYISAIPRQRIKADRKPPTT